VKVVWRSDTTESGAPSVMIISPVLTPTLCVASLVTGNSNYMIHVYPSMNSF